ncbi:MAG: anaerobic ribonucleoside-triphosphate reductase activating protein [Candidatus Paceibacterota bacterium]|jgi:pyruvate formate lyase activating enzyme
MQIGGIQKTTLIDFPGKIACTVFLAGCNFYCPWCHSGELVEPKAIKKLSKTTEKEFLDFLEQRRGLLEGVVICGGEPTLNEDLPLFCRKIKTLGFEVKLDTNGSNPKLLDELISDRLLDYIAMDVKLPFERYAEVCHGQNKAFDIQKSINIIKSEKVDYEFRTTVVPSIHSREDILNIARWISPAKKYYLQNFRPEKTIDPEFEKIAPYPLEYLTEVQQVIAPFFEDCRIRSL